MQIVTLVSGGVDSTLMSLMAQEEGVTLFPLFVDYGQLGAEREWQVAFARFTNAPVTVLRDQREIWSCDRARAFETTGRFFLWFAVERHPEDLKHQDK